MQLPILTEAIQAPSPNTFTYEMRGICDLLTVRPRIKVPSYQRTFAWEHAHVEALWVDLMEAMSRSSSGAEPELDYFIGSIVLTSNQGADEPLEYQVIDGQQRLTAVTLLATAIRDKLRELGDARHLDVQKVLGHTDLVEQEVDWRLKLQDEMADLFEKSILALPEERKPIDENDSNEARCRLRSAFAQMSGYVKGLAEAQGDDKTAQAKSLVILFRYMQDNLRVLELVTSSESNAYMIFETLNDRGADLTLAELLKNFLFGTAASKSPGSLKSVKKAWSAGMEALEVPESQRTRFLKHHWSSVHGHTTERLLYANMKTKLNGFDSVLNYTEGLQPAADVYSAIESPGHSFWNGLKPSDHKCRRAIESLGNLDAQQCRPLLIAILQEWTEPALVADGLQLALNWHVRTMVAGNAGSGSLEQAYCNLALKVRNGEISSVTDLRKDALARSIPADASFRDKFESYQVSAAKPRVARYMLSALEYHESGNEVVVNSDPGEVNLEHVLPKRPKQGQWNSFPESERSSYLNRVGNLVLLLASENTSAGNAEFEEKRAVYKASKLALTSKVAGSATWTPLEVQARQAELARGAVKCWPR